jgi:osmoprotectant transport system substrate-binding protein
MTMRKTVSLAAALTLFVFLVAWPAVLDACVGKTLFLGRLPGREQEILAELFVWLVSERTGTSIEVKPFSGSRETHSALEKAEIDVYLEEAAVALGDILGREIDGSGEAVRRTVKEEYKKKFNLVWLEPWGLEGSTGAGEAAKIAPVVRRDTLKKFPALSRLVNKMAGVVDDEAMKKMVTDSSARPVREVTKSFLKEKKLI